MIFGIFGKFRIDIGVQKNSEIFFFEMKNFLEKYVFEKFGNCLDIFENFQNSIGIWMIPFITPYKGNHRNPNIIWGFFKNVQKFPKNPKTYFSIHFFHLEKKSQHFSEYLCRCKISPGFQKSHLEHQPIKLKMPKTRCKKNIIFFRAI